MGNLNNLYISQSFQSLAHLGTNTSLVPGTMTVLQDGIGQSLNISFDGTNISSSGNIFGANITASVVNTGSLVTTSSFNQYTASTNIRLNNLESNSASVNVSISNLNSTTASQATSISNLNAATSSYVTETESGSFLLTASFDNGTRNLTFTKGNNTTFNVNIPDVSGSAGNFVTTSSFNAYTQSTDDRLTNIESTTASLNSSVTQLNASSASQQVSINNLNTTTASLLIETQNLELFSASALTSLSNLNTATASLFTSASLSLTTASVSGTTMTFTKGNGTTFNVTLPTGSGGGTINTGSFATTGSNNFIGDQYISNGVLQVATYPNTTKSWFSPTTIEAIGTQSVAYEQFVDGGGYDTFNVVTTLDNGTEFRDVTSDTFTLTTWLSIPQNTGNNPAPQFKRGLSVTGSTNIAELTASLQQGHLFVGNSSGRTTTVATSSFVTTNQTSSFAIIDANNNFTATNTFSGVTRYAGGSDNIATTQLVNNQTLLTKNVSISSGNNSGSFQQLSMSTGSGGNASFQMQATLSGSTADLSIFNSAGATSARILADTILIAKREGFPNTPATTFTAEATTINLRGNVDISGSLTASLQQGYVWVGDSTGKTVTVATSSFGGGGSTNTGSLMVTGSIAGNILTFTKGDASTFNLTIPSATGSVFNTGSFATTGSNTFYGNQTIATGDLIMGNGFNINSPSGQITNLAASNTIQFITEGAAGPGGTNDIKFINRVSGSKIIFENTQGGQGNTIEFTAGAVSFDIGARSGSTGKVTFGSNTTSIEALSTQILAQRLLLSGPLTASLQQGYAWVGGAGDVSTLVATSSFGSGGTGFATTGSNTFTGDQTLIDNAGNFFTISDASGSMMLVAKGFTSASAHLSASSAGIGNFIFKTNSNTADTIISGSGNIFTNATAPTAGFKRYVGGTNNIINTSGLPQISGSMQFSPSMNANYQAGNITMRGPVSSSAWTMNSNNILGNVSIGPSATANAEKLVSGLSMTTNNILGTLNITANQSALTGSTTTLSNNLVVGTAILQLSSSAATLVGNIINDSGFTFTNQFFSSSIGLGNVTLSRNNIAGQLNSLIVVGAQPAGTTNGTSFSDNFIGGGGNIVYGDIANARVSGSTAYHNAIRNMVFGNFLIITGSSLLADANSYGSAFFGRYNSTDGNKDLTNETIFAVGTGNATTRKTGFLIDSGSNTFIEGTLNVSGSTTLSGSLYIQSASTFPTQIGTSLVTWNSATGQLGQATTTTLISSSFSAGEFFSTTTLSGSAGVSASIELPNTAISNGVSIQSNSQMVVSNSGTYNIQFSAQADAFDGADTIWIWFKKNGTNIADSASKLIMQNNTAAIMTVNIFDNAVPNDYFEVVWQNNAGFGKLISDAATGNIPRIPSVIVTVNQVK
jgi:fibronectin-binding autotransporter adhesin